MTDQFQVSTVTPAEWEAFIATHPRPHVLQQWAWGDLKAAFGWQADRIALINTSGEIAAAAQVLYRRLPFRLGTMAYLAMGPLIGYRSSDANYLLEANLWDAIDAASRKHHAAFLKWEPGIFPNQPASTQTDISVLNTQYSALPDGFRASPQTVQPPNTVMIDISDNEDAIMARMNQGTRRKIRQSLKNGITYREGTKSDVAIFTGMMNTTGERNAFGVHEPAYYQQAYDLFVPQGDAALILAEHEGDALAGIMVFAKGTTAWYLYGASSNVKRNLMGAYGVQWAALQWAKAKGCIQYDMWGIPDADEPTLEAQFESRSDGLWGVYGFKRGWGGAVVRSLGAWDKVYNPVIYAAYQLALKVRSKAV